MLDLRGILMEQDHEVMVEMNKQALGWMLDAALHAGLAAVSSYAGIMLVGGVFKLLGV